jgi:toxin ParE1/3/4
VTYRVELTGSATSDIDDIVDWVAHNDSPENAIKLLDKIQSKVESLAHNPERGSVPPEMRTLGLDKYREIFFKPYRIIYHVREHHIIVNLIADGRRDMTALLQRRLTDLP